MKLNGNAVLAVAVMVAAILPLGLEKPVDPGRSHARAPAGVPAVPQRPGSAALPPGNAGQMTAIALRHTALREARAEFWKQIARCVNESGSGLGACFLGAQGDLDEAVELAQDQYDARMFVCQVVGHQAYDPQINAAQFTDEVTHPHLPFIPGRTLVYQKLTTEGLEEIRLTVDAQSQDIGGISCRPVRELESLNGVVFEDSLNWFAQKNDGSVWYFGEVASHYEDGILDNLDGSWRYGKDGAKPGIIIPGNPTVGSYYRQEFALNVAEDVSVIIATNVTVTTPAGTFTGCIEVEETTPLEPQERERKFYAPGVGVVKEVDVNTGAVLNLVQIIN